MNKKRNDLTQLLNSIDRNNYEYYSDLSDDEKKNHSNWVAMRWASQSDYPIESIIMTNELVNIKYNDINSEELAWISIASTGTNNSSRYQWVPPPRKKKSDTHKYIELVSKIRPLWSSKEIELFIKINDKNKLKEWIEEYGYEQ